MATARATYRIVEGADHVLLVKPTLGSRVMIIVAGTFDVAPDERATYLAGRAQAQLDSRAEAGCIEYVFSADSLDPGRVRLFEIWESQEHLDQHLHAIRSAPAPTTAEAPVNVIAREIMVYPIIADGPHPL
jgi:quinol monooxygenase YgiN